MTVAQAGFSPAPPPPAEHSSSATYNGTAGGTEPTPGLDAVPYTPALGQSPAAKDGVGDKLKDAGSWLKDYSTALKHGS